jgi:hypothetical protein
MLMTQRLYIKALKKQMGVWRTKWTEDRLRKMMQEFVSNEKLYTEIVRTSLLMCNDVEDEGEILIVFECNFEMIESMMSQFHLDVPVAWRYVMDGVKYGTDEDPTRIDYDIAAVKRNIRDMHPTAQGANDLQPHADMQSRLLQMQRL